MQMQSGIFSTADVARQAGVHKDTLLRWLRAGLVSEPRRDRHGWRYFSGPEASAIVAFARSTTEQAAGSLFAAEEEGRYLGRLSKIDWDFADAKTKYLTHGIHPYPAKFIPQIPNALIQELSAVGETVGDIFCGSGTTLVEALTLKRHAVGVDANPLASLISKAKTASIDSSDIEYLQQLSRRAAELSETIAAPDGDLFAPSGFKSASWRPDYEKLDFWFEKHVIEELAEVLGWCRQIPSESARDLALTAFSAIVVSVSNQDSDTRYVRRSKGIRAGETLRRFARSVDDCTHAAIEFTELVESRFRCDVVTADLLEHPDIPPLDLVVCSPPYPNAYSYHLYHMTRMLWLEMNQPKFKREEIGSHRKYSRKGKNGATADTFREEFTSILRWLGQRLKKGGYACFVVGDSTLKGVRVRNADLICAAGSETGFLEVMRVERTMQDSKKAFNPAIGKIKSERILVLENRGGGT